MEERKLTGYPSIDKPWLKYYSDDVLKSRPFDGSIYQHIYEKNKDFLCENALQYFGRNITYRDVFRNADLVSETFSAYGIKRGDNVAVFMSSCPELVYLILGMNKIGAVVNMINPLFDSEQIIERTNDTQATIMVVLDQLYGCIAEIKDLLCVKKIVVVPIEQSMPCMTRLIAHHKLKQSISYGGKVIAWNDFISRAGDADGQASIETDGSIPAIMVYSSGTTGASKGIVLTNNGINATISHYEHSGFEYNRGEKYLQIVPTWFSTGTVMCLLLPLCLGIIAVLEPVFSEKSFEEAILKYKPNMIMGATSLWLHFMNALQTKPRDLSFITYPITGGEKTLPETEIELNRFLSRNGCKKHLLTGYGMCELGSTATAASMQYAKPGTAGYPILGATVAAFDIDSNQECRYGERGEIRVLTPARMKEYFNRPDATAEFFWKDNNGNEWGRTGDIGYVDEDGFVYVQGRATDYFVNRTGEKIYCFDIEDEILKVDEVYQCEVIGIDSSNGYEIPVAFMVLHNGINVDSKKIIEAVKEHCINHIDKNSIPAVFRIIDKFPVKPSGKRDMEEIHRMASEIVS